ncbi:DnaD domain protein [Eubacteriaceae bacterium ES3]|nr:DnaD domain protein [Eubacteriaceae bacterium ES3]
MNHFKFVLNHDDLGVTPLENIFINHYMPSARGDYVKVYLYGLKRCYNSKLSSISNTEIAKDLRLLETDVKRAWDYWAEEGIISIDYIGTSDANICFLNITGTYLYKNKPIETPAKDSTALNEMEKRIQQMYDKIQDMYESRSVSKAEMLMFKHWLQNYNFTPEAVILIVEYSINMINNKEKSFTPAQVKNYLEKVAESFYGSGVRDHLDVEKHIEKLRTRRKNYYEILNLLGLRRNPMASEQAIMDRWLTAFPMEIIKEALSRSNQPNLKYIDGILKKWQDKGFTTLEAVQSETRPSTRKETSMDPISESRKQAYVDMSPEYAVDLWDELEISDEN